MQTDECENCGQRIGKLETPFVWGQSIVCGICYKRLLASKGVPPMAVSEPVAVDVEPPAESTGDALSDLAAAASRSRGGGAKPLNYASYRTGSKGNFFQRWQRKCGKRSFILQGILAGWTALIVCLAVAMLFSSAEDINRYPAGSYSHDGAALGLITSWLCLFGGWAVIGIPLGIAAVVTLRSDEG